MVLKQTSTILLYELLTHLNVYKHIYSTAVTNVKLPQPPKAPISVYNQDQPCAFSHLSQLPFDYIYMQFILIHNGDGS